MQEPNKESNHFSGNSISLVVICDEKNINNNGKFFEELKKLTSPQFASSKNQLKTIYEISMHSIKKKITGKDSFAV